MIYFFIIFLLICLIYIYDYRKVKRFKTESFVSVLLFLILFSGFSYRLGVDVTRYIDAYKEFPLINKIITNNYSLVYPLDRWGKGFIILFSLCRSITKEFYFFHLIHSLIINTIFFYFIYKNTKKIFFGILLYFLILYIAFNFEVLRESLAVSIFLLAWKYFINNNWIKYYLLCLIAISFHPSAYLTLVFPLFYIPIIRKLFKVNILFIFTCVGILASTIIISQIFFEYIQLIELEDIESYANSYSQSSLGEARELGIKGIIFFILRNVIYPLSAIIFLKRYLQNNNSNKLNNYRNKLEYFICWFIYINIANLGISIFYRFSNYLNPFIIICLADCIFDTIKTKKYKYHLSFGIWMLIMLPYSYLRIHTYIKDDSGSGIPLYTRYYPYYTYLSEKKDEKREKLFDYLSF